MRRPTRILVVDDEPAVREVLRQGLEGAGFSVLEAMDKAEMFRALDDGPIDLITLDLGLGDSDGLELALQIRAVHNIPIVMITGRSAPVDRVKGLEQGADDYLTKPFAFVELLARVRALLRRGQPAPERLQVGDLALDCIRRKVARGAETIELAPKEFGILEYMMRNRGRPLSRTMIVEHVWDMDYDGLTNIVDVYIRHLRSKIDDRFAQKLIQTVRGIGYMIEAPDKPAERPADAVTQA